jgi:hypothetical protein
MSEYGAVTEPGTVRIERMLPGPIERIWSYLTDSDKRRTWLAHGAIELRLGGSAEHVFRNSELSTPDDPPPAKYADVADSTVMNGIVACDPPRLWPTRGMKVGAGVGSAVRAGAGGAQVLWS